MTWQCSNFEQMAVFWLKAVSNLDLGQQRLKSWYCQAQLRIIRAFIDEVSYSTFPL